VLLKISAHKDVYRTAVVADSRWYSCDKSSPVRMMRRLANGRPDAVFCVWKRAGQNYRHLPSININFDRVLHCWSLDEVVEVPCSQSKGRFHRRIICQSVVLSAS